jgi:TolA-binding protein
MKRKQASLTLLPALLVSLMMTLPGCLKTRAQLRGEGGDDAGAPGTAAGAANPVQEVQPQGQYVIDEIKTELTRLNGRIEDLERAQKQSASNPAGASKEDLKPLETRMAELEKAQAVMIETLQKLQASTPVPENASLFNQGKEQFNAQNYEGAAESLSGYLKTPKAKKAEEATFLRAESYFNLKQYKKAIADYSKFTEDYTKSSRMPTVLYRIGLSFEGLGMKEDARAFFQELADKFPKAPETKKAKAKIK